MITLTSASEHGNSSDSQPPSTEDRHSPALTLDHPANQKEVPGRPSG